MGWQHDGLTVYDYDSSQNLEHDSPASPNLNIKAEEQHHPSHFHVSIYGSLILVIEVTKGLSMRACQFCLRFENQGLRRPSNSREGLSICLSAPPSLLMYVVIRICVYTYVNTYMYLYVV